jgi:hypothetical protein
MSRDVQRCPEMSRDVQGCPEMSRDVDFDEQSEFEVRLALASWVLEIYDCLFLTKVEPVWMGFKIYESGLLL